MPETIAAMTVGEMIAASFAATAAGMSAYQGMQAGEASKKQAEAQARSAEMQERARQEQVKIEQLKIERERRKIIREARIQRAGVVAGAEALGVGTSSAATGAISSVRSQETSNTGFMDATQSLSNRANEYLGSASQYSTQALGFQSQAADASAYSNLFAQGASLANSALPTGFWGDTLGLSKQATVPQVTPKA